MNNDKISKFEQLIQSDYRNIAGIVVSKNKEVVYESYFNGFNAQNTLHVFSVTKSLFSALVGIAIEKGFLQSVQQKVLDFFPDYAVGKGQETAQIITLQNMLTMTAPYQYETEPYEAFFMSENWMDFALGLLGGKGRVGDFIYSGIVGTHILSGILVRATGMSVLDFANEHLFLPLDISVPSSVLLRTKEEHIAAMHDINTSGWAVDPQGIHPAGWGLFLKPLDMVKYGQLYLDGGMLNGRSIVPAAWVAQSTKEQSRWGAMPYGYLWWIVDPKEHSYAAMGDGGNMIYVNPNKQAVIAIASFFAPDVKDRIALIQEQIEPLFV